MRSITRIVRAGSGIVLVGALAAACAPGNRAVNSGSAGTAGSPGTSGPTPAQVAPSTVPTTQTPAAGAPTAAATAPAQPVAPAAGATEDPQQTADTQAADQILSQLDASLSTMDQATSSGETDVPGN
jgi:hypothetical protein